MEDFLTKAKKSSTTIATLSSKVKKDILNQMADALVENCIYIIEENAKDMHMAKENNLNSAMVDRLLLNKQRV